MKAKRNFLILTLLRACKNNRLLQISLLSTIYLSFAFSQDISIVTGMNILRKSYPEVSFVQFYDEGVDDYRIEITVEERVSVLYWAGGRMLPKSELNNKNKYWPILYSYPKELDNPSDLTEEQIERIKEFGSTENRKNGAGAPMFFFDAIYDSSTRGKLESHLKKTSFLGRNTTVHELIVPQLKKVEKRIREAEKTDESIKAFIQEMKSAEAYYWRIIAGTNRKSFHSLGIAIDIQPKKLNGKEIYWGWAKDRRPEDWMLVSLEDRWLPPQKVIDIFEEEGFIWGGKWTIFDNMHFEYHPELIEYNFNTEYY